MTGQLKRYAPGLESTRSDGLKTQEGFLKGQIAENIIERLFDAHGYEILPYGVEKRFPGWLYDHNIPKDSPAYRQLRATPDFVAKVPKRYGPQKNLIPIEVKFRTVGHIEPHELVRYEGFHSAVLILVDPKGIRGNLVAHILGGGSPIPVVELGILRLKSNIVEYFEQVVQQLYKRKWPNSDDYDALPNKSLQPVCHDSPTNQRV